MKYNYLTDNLDTEDLLNIEIYADSILEIVKQQKNINIGIYGEWGKGKSFLINMIKNKLENNEKQEFDNYIKESNIWLCCGCNNQLTNCIYNSIINNFNCLSKTNRNIFDNIENNNNIRNNNNDNLENDIENNIEYQIKKCCFRCGKVNENDNNCNKCFKLSFTQNLCYTHQEYITIDFNAWVYNGSDNLWSSLINVIQETLENEFGWFSFLWFRIIEYQNRNFYDKLNTILYYLFFYLFPVGIGYFVWYLLSEYHQQIYGDISYIIYFFIYFQLELVILYGIY